MPASLPARLRCAGAAVVAFQLPGGVGMDRLRQMERAVQLPFDCARNIAGASHAASAAFGFVVAGNGFLAADLRVFPDGMAAALAHQFAAMFLKMAEQGPAFHASVSSVVSACGSSRNTSSRSVSSKS